MLIGRAFGPNVWNFADDPYTGIYVSFAFAEVLLHLSLELFSTTLDVLTHVIRGITQIAANLAFRLLHGAFDFVLETAIVNVPHEHLRCGIKVVPSCTSLNASDMPP